MSAEHAAAERGDFSAFDAAHVAAQQGKPLPAVAAPAAAPAQSDDDDTPTQSTTAQAPAPTVSKRQQQINDYERRIAEQDQRIRALEASRQTPPAARAQPQAPVTPAEPAWKRYAAMPDAPKLSDVDAQGNALFASVEEHTAAMFLFIRGQEQAAEQRRTVSDEHRAAMQSRVERIHQAITEAAQDPTFATSLSDEVRTIKPVSSLAPDEPSGPLNILWELVYDSPYLAQHLRNFSANPGELRRIEAMPPRIAALPAHMRAAEHVKWMVQEFGKLEGRLESTAPSASAPAAQASTISAAPPPPPTLSRTGSTTNPQEAAIARGDQAGFEQWDKIETAKVQARRNGAA